MKVSDEAFFRMVDETSQMRLHNQDMTIDTIANACINKILDEERLEIDETLMGDLLFRVVYAVAR